MVVLTLLFVRLILIFLVNTILSNYYSYPGRSSVSLLNVSELSRLFSKSLGLTRICSSLLLLLAFMNFSGNIPGVMIPSLYYYFTCSVSLIF